MRIFQALDSTSNAAVSANQTWLRNLCDPLLDLGHQVILFSTAEGRLAMQRQNSQGRAEFSQKLLDSFRREHARESIDLFFAYLLDGMVEPTVIDEIRKSGVPTCNFSCNNAHQFYLVDELSPHFDYNLHSEKGVREKFIAIGANPLWWPMASNPKYFRPVDVPRTIQASFVGANYALRAKYITHLLENGVDVHAYGPGWIRSGYRRWRSLARHYMLVGRALLAFSSLAQSTASARLAEYDYRRSLDVRFPVNLHPAVSDDELIALYSRSHISLGFLEVFDLHDPSRAVTQHLHLREFEAPMCGALYCTGYMDELAEMFEPEKEVVTYRNQHELLDKTRYYLNNPAQAELIRQAGRRRALAEHTYHHRFRNLFTAIGLTP